MTRYGDGLGLREARARYFDENGFGSDGGYGAAWVKLRLGPIALRLPNTAARVRAVRYHDLHHLATDYATDWTGEAEIAAWEIAGSCADHHAAWLLNLWAMAIGLVIAPRAVFRAFRRGRRSHNLYREPWSDALLEGSVGALRQRLGLAEPAAASGPARAGERLAFVGWSAIALGVAGATLAVFGLPALLLVRALA